MRTIIAGSRTVTNPKTVKQAVNSAVVKAGIWPTEIVEGGARGVDTLAFDFAWEQGIPVKVFPADWKQHGRAAGVLRNREMAKYAEALIAIWDGKSRGTKNMIEEAEKCGLKVYVHHA